jgi:hypothetical protein
MQNSLRYRNESRIVPFTHPDCSLKFFSRFFFVLRHPRSRRIETKLVVDGGDTQLSTNDEAGRRELHTVASAEMPVRQTSRKQTRPLINTRPPPHRTWLSTQLVAICHTNTEWALWSLQTSMAHMRTSPGVEHQRDASLAPTPRLMRGI